MFLENNPVFFSGSKSENMFSFSQRRFPSNSNQNSNGSFANFELQSALGQRWGKKHETNLFIPSACVRFPACLLGPSVPWPVVLSAASVAVQL
jgi:hypothetical protein